MDILRDETITQCIFATEESPKECHSRQQPRSSQRPTDHQIAKQSQFGMASFFRPHRLAPLPPTRSFTSPPRGRSPRAQSKMGSFFRARPEARQHRLVAGTTKQSQFPMATFFRNHGPASIRQTSSSRPSEQINRPRNLRWVRSFEPDLQPLGKTKSFSYKTKPIPGWLRFFELTDRLSLRPTISLRAPSCARPVRDGFVLSSQHQS
jgi:hypothetical protein